MKTTQVLVKLPDMLLQKIDEIVLEEGFTSRQEFIREIIRERIRASARVELVEEEVHARRRQMRVESRGHPHLFGPASKGCQAGGRSAQG